MTLDMDNRTSDHLPPRLDLPVPRVELVYECPERGGRFDAMWYHRLVLRHLEGFAYALDISTTGTTDRDPLRHQREGGKIAGPWRSGVAASFDARHLGVPTFLVVGDVAEELPAYDARHYARVTTEAIRPLEDETEEDDEAG